MRVEFKEDKVEFCNKLCELLRMTSNLGIDEYNSLVELRYIKKENGDEVVSPRFYNNPERSDGYYDINVTGNNCMGILADVYEKFIRRY